MPPRRGPRSIVVALLPCCTVTRRPTPCTLNTLVNNCMSARTRGRGAAARLLVVAPTSAYSSYATPLSRTTLAGDAVHPVRHSVYIAIGHTHAKGRGGQGVGRGDAGQARGATPTVHLVTTGGGQDWCRCRRIRFACPLPYTTWSTLRRARSGGGALWAHSSERCSLPDAGKMQHGPTLAPPRRVRLWCAWITCA